MASDTKCRYFVVCITFRIFASYHSFSSLSYDRSKASSKASSPHSAIQSFLFQMRVSLSFIHLAVCLTTGPKPLPKRALRIMRSRASSFKREYPLLSLRSSNSFLRLLPCLPVTSIPPCIFPSVTRCRRQFRRKHLLMWFKLNCMVRGLRCALHMELA